MKIVEQLLAIGAIIGLSTSGFAGPANEEDVLWAAVCGRPDMRIAISLGRDQQDDDGDCAEACHAALCRKSFDTLRKGDAHGAAV